MVSRRMASWKIVSRKMAALQMVIAVYRSGRFGFGRPGTVPCRGAVHAFLRTCILAWNGFLHSMHGRDICVPQCTSQPLEGFNWQQARIPCLDSAGSKSGSQTCAQSAMGLDSIWISHLCSTGNRQLAIGKRQQVCIPYPSIQPVFHRYQSGRRIVVHSATVRRPDNAGEGTQPQEKRSRICSAVP